MTTIMQPLHCDLQPEIQEVQRNTHTRPTTRCRTQTRNRLRSKQSKPQPPHTQGTCHRRLQPLYTEKRKVCSSFLSNTSPMQQSCSHYNAFCSTTFTSMQPLQCDLHPRVAEHQGGTDCARNDPNRNRRTHELPFSAGRSHFTQKNVQDFVLRSSPTQVPCNIHAAITNNYYNAFCSTTYTSMQPLQCNLHPRIAEQKKEEPITP